MDSKFRLLKIASNIIADWVSKEDHPDGPPKENGPWHETPKGYGNKKTEESHSGTEDSTKEFAEMLKTQTPKIIRTPYDEGVEVTANDVYFLQYGDKKTVFKPTTDRDQYIRETITFDKVPSSKREVIAFEISKKLGLNIIPPTALTKRTVPSLSDDFTSMDIEDKEKEGSEQAFVDGETWIQYCLKSGEEKVREILKDDTIQKNLSVLAITDYIIGNSDRHVSNLMINDKKEIIGIDNGCSFAPNGEVNSEGKGEFRSLPLDILYRMYQDYDLEYSLSQMRFKDYNDSEFSTDYEMFTKFEILKDAGGIHPEICKFFQEMDYDSAEKNISEIMEHYGMDDKSAQNTIDRLRNIQNLFN